MIARRRINLYALPDQVLVYFHNKLFDDKAVYTSFSALSSIFPQQPANAIRLVLDSLVDDGLVEQREERRFRPTSSLASLGIGSVTTPSYWEPVDGYRLSKKGVTRVEDMDDELFQRVQAEINLTEPNLNTESEVQSPEAPNDEWEPIQLDKDDPQLKDTIERTQEALTAIEQDNGFAAKEPELRNGIVETIRGSLNALREGLPSKGSIIEGLVKPLKKIGKIFGTNFVGEMARAAVKAICALFGIPLQ